MSISTAYTAGPRPMNTLTRGAAIARPPVNRGLNGLHQNRRELDTITSTGNNVKSSTLEFDPDSTLLGEPRSKRQKFSQHHNSQNTPHVLDGSDDADEMVLDDHVLQIRHIPKDHADGLPGKKRSGVSQGTAPYTERRTFQASRPTEYHVVEDLMDSSLPNSKKRRKQQQKQRAHDVSATAPTPFASSPSESLELLDGEFTTNPVVQMKSKYRGTMDLHPSRRSEAAREPIPRRSTADRSPHSPPPTFMEPSGTVQPLIGTEGGPSSTGALPTDQSRANLDGPRCSTSSDELVVAEPNSRALSPVKPACSQSPTKGSQPNPIRSTSNNNELDDLGRDQGNIKPSAFTSIANNGIRSKVCAYQGRYPDESPAPWSMALRSYNFQGKVNKDNGLAFVYNDTENSYDIHCSGSKLASRYPGLRIQPSKLQKIRFEFGGTKMRFESSKTGSVDNILDLELRGEKDVQDLNALLQQGSSLDVKGLSGERMDKLFNHKLQEARKAIDSRKTSVSNQPTDVQLASMRVERADKKRISVEKRQSSVKRPRVVDTLRSENQSGDNRRVRQGQPSKKNIDWTHEHGRAQEKPETSDEVMEPLNNIIKGYKLRAQSTSGSLTTKPKELSPSLINERFEKYSRANGLGIPWPKPLVYPKEGKKRTTVDWNDLERLDEGNFLNDNLIAFYLRYLEYQAEQADPAVTRKVHMFNSFFYDSLTSMKAGHKGINYDAVQKWTRGTDIFTYDFVVVPVNESAHWYVAIICNLPALDRKPGGLETSLGQYFEPPDEIRSDQSPRDDTMFPSSPRTAASDAGNRDLSPLMKYDTEDVKERETAASFAEMSLESNGAMMDNDGPSPEIPVASRSDNADQELVDRQLRHAIPDGTNRHERVAREAESTARKDEDAVQMERLPSLKLKPGTRKSLPSPRTFDPYKPTILTFDSFGTAHPITVKVLKQYLREEANDKRGHMQFDEKELQGATAKQIPQQDNFCDCGLFLLGYMEKFFENPREFIDKVMRKEWDVQRDWPSLNPSNMRSNMRELLMALGESQRKEWMDVKSTKGTSKGLKGPTSSTPGSIGKARPSNVDGPNEAEKTPTKLVSKVSQQAPVSARKAALESAAEIGESIGQASPTSKTAALEAPFAIDQLDRPRTSAAEFIPLRPDCEATAITDATTPSERGFQNPSPPTAIQQKEGVADVRRSPPLAVTITEEPSPQSFCVLDSQPESSSVPKPQESVAQDPESIAISPVLPSTIQDSQPTLPAIALESLPKEATPPPLPKARRHIDSFSSPVPSKPTRSHDAERRSPRTPRPRDATEAAHSSSDPRRTKRPILGATPAAVVGTDPKVVIHIDD